ncbi:GRP family sugar transporter [Gynurincola endophyticus]|jgi:glucose uptake protein|uniref:GRP family sugar transporter n=1 Tax=Gynurincola endophyticus TaxID=2479004 RepID=UPI000F8CFCF6|nr:GRP family sugar transporter [Gynurincola endophyticus]
MFLVSSYTLAVVFTIITMLCWGSWGNTQKLSAAKTWRFELYYWDYVIGLLLTTLIAAFTLGSTGTEGRSFLADWSQADTANLVTAMLGGAVFNLSNILLSAAMAVAGMAVAFPVGVGLALVLGVLVNYAAAPYGNAGLLFIGVGLVVVAIILDAVAYRRVNRSTGNVSVKGIALAIAAGVLMSFFYRFVAASMSDDFANPAAGKLTPYTALVCFGIGVFISNFLFNTILMKRPISGSALSYKDYFKGNFLTHLTGVLGGIIWCIGMLLNILAAGKAGYAISYGLGQGATLVAALWGVFIWKEFKSNDPNVKKLVTLMFLFFLSGIVLLVLAGM